MAGGDRHGLEATYTVLDWDVEADDFVFQDETPITLLETDDFEEVARLINGRVK